MKLFVALPLLAATLLCFVQATTPELLYLNLCSDTDSHQRWTLDGNTLKSEQSKYAHPFQFETDTSVTFLVANEQSPTDRLFHKGVSGKSFGLNFGSGKCVAVSHFKVGGVFYVADCKKSDPLQTFSSSPSGQLMVTNSDGQKLCATHQPLGADRIVVHFVEHTHDDVGWLTTLQGYYLRSVRDILDQAVSGLQQDEARKYTYVEIAFFQTWWKEQTDTVKNAVRQLVASGRLEFTNAGWSMNDEAACHYSDIIDNMALGHMWLQSQFGSSLRPSTGWQIDPFGHTNTMAWLYSKMGFNMFFFGRAPEGTPDPYQFVWRPFYSTAAAGGNQDAMNIWGYYHKGYCGEPINANALEMVAWSVEKKIAAYWLGIPDLIDLHGCDFSKPTFKETDAMIDFVRKHYDLSLDINATYSTPIGYYTSANTRNHQFDLFAPPNDDLMPYWTGFFTSQQNFKQNVRKASSFFHSATALNALSPRRVKSSQWIEQVKKLNVLWMALGVVQHHDGITGTAEPFVYDDYNSRLDTGIEGSSTVVSQAIADTLGVDDSAVSVCPPGRTSTSCDQTAVSNSFFVSVFNPLSWTRGEWVRVAVPLVWGDHFQVSRSSTGQMVQPQVIPGDNASVAVLIWYADELPPLGVVTYTVKAGDDGTGILFPVAATQPFTVENDVVSLHFAASGRLSSWSNKITGASNTASIDVLWYQSAADGNDGAYDFKAKNDNPFRFPGDNGQAAAQIIRGPLFTDVIVAIDAQSSVAQRYRLYQGERFVEVITDIGPVDVSDNKGKDVILRVTTDVASAGKFFVDGSGMEMMERTRGLWKLGQKPGNSPGKNYYPATIMSAVRDADSQVLLIGDKSEGVGSELDGSIESMIYRRLLKGDGKGMDTPLNGTDPLRTVHWVSIADLDEGKMYMRPLSHRMYNPPVVAIATEATDVFDWSPLVAPLPANVHIQNLQVYVANWTLQQCPDCDIPPPSGRVVPPDPAVDPTSLPDGTIILRLAHIYASDEAGVLSQPVTVDLGNLFATFKVSSVAEYSITANQPITDISRLTWNYKTRSAADPVTSFPVTISPMDIRTFVLQVNYL